MSLNDVTSASPRVLRYSDTLVHDLKLLEIPAALMEELEGGGRVAFKGTADHPDAVLCTSKSTYDVREVETTNLVMLVDGMNDGMNDGSSHPDAQNPPVSVTALAKAHLELTLINPRLDMLDVAVRQNHVITDIVTERSSLPVGQTWEALRDSVQASDAELGRALEEMDVVRVGGGWMGVSADAFSSFVKLVVLTATEQGMDLGAVDMVAMALALEGSGVCGEVSLQLLNKLRAKAETETGTAEGGITEGEIRSHRRPSVEDLDRSDWRERCTELIERKLELDGKVALDMSLVSRHIGIGVLLEREYYEDKREFVSAWSDGVPEGVTVGMHMLRGEALEVTGEALGEHGNKVGRTGVRRLCAREMPRDTTRRFECLWKAKEKWTLEEIVPYIEGLAAPGQNTEELLLKWARPSQTRPEDPVVYTKR